MEEKQGFFTSIRTAIRALSTDYSSEEKTIEQQVAELEKIQKQIAQEQKDFGASLRVNKPQSGAKGKSRLVPKKEQQLDDREI